MQGFGLTQFTLLIHTGINRSFSTELSLVEANADVPKAYRDGIRGIRRCPRQPNSAVDRVAKFTGLRRQVIRVSACASGRAPSGWEGMTACMLVAKRLGPCSGSIWGIVMAPMSGEWPSYVGAEILPLWPHARLCKIGL